MNMLLSLLMVGMVAGQETLEDIKNLKVTEVTVKDLTNDNGLDMAQSFRCGLFFAGENVGDKPMETLYIIPKLFPASCPAKDTDLQTYKSFCKALFEKIGEKVNYETASINKTRAAEGFNTGDDICGLLKKDHKIRHVGTPKAKRFKEGLEIGFYHNSCAEPGWFDTELRMPEGPICCEAEKDDDTGKFVAKFKRCKGQKRPNGLE